MIVLTALLGNMDKLLVETVATLLVQRVVPIRTMLLAVTPRVLIALLAVHHPMAA